MDVVKEIKKKLRIFDIFEGEKNGDVDAFVACCPFPNHEDKEPSFQVERKSNHDIFFCHGCKEGGSVIDFVARINNLTIQQAINHCCELLGIKNNSKYVKKINYQSIYSILKWHDFFADRGISKEIVKKFGVGYIDNIANYKLDHNLLLSDNMIGNIKDSIFYPIRDRVGRDVGYYYRPLVTKKAKYVCNSKSQIFGLHMLTQRTPYVIAVEGHNDVLKLYSKGIKNVIGLSGTNYNYNIMRALADLSIYRLIIVPDADNGGERYRDNIIRKYGTFDNCGVGVSIAWMPSFSGDPKDYVDTNKDFFLNIDKYSVPVTKLVYDDYKDKNTLTIDVINQIVRERTYIKPIELQLLLGDELGALEIKERINTFYNAKYEKIILGSMLKDIVCRNEVLVNCNSDFFAVTEYKEVFEYIRNNTQATIETISNEFNIELDSFDPNNINMYIDELELLSQKREFWNCILKYDHSIVEKNGDIEPIITSLTNDILDLDTNQGRIKSVTSSQVIRDAIDLINSGDLHGMDISSKFPTMNTLARGLSKESLVIVAANSGVGKTSFALNIVDCISFEQKYKTLILTNEMSPSKLMLRQFAIRSEISYNDIVNRVNFLSSGQLEAMNNDLIAYRKIPYIEDTYKELLLEYNKYGGLDLIVFDYLQLAISRDSREKRDIQLKILTGALKKFAVEKKCTVLALAQLNRDNTKERVSKAENISGSYAMVGDADIVLTLGIPKKKDHNPIIGGNLELNLDKVRDNSDKIIIPANFSKKNLRITEVSKSRGGVYSEPE